MGNIGSVDALIEPEVDITRLQNELTVSPEVINTIWSRSKEVLSSLDSILALPGNSLEERRNKNQQLSFFIACIKIGARNDDETYEKYSKKINSLITSLEINVLIDDSLPAEENLQKIIRLFGTINFQIKQKRKRKEQEGLQNQLSNLFFDSKHIKSLEGQPENYFHITKNLTKNYRDLPSELKSLCTDWFKYILIREPDAVFKYSKYFDNVGGKALIFDFCEANKELLLDPSSETHKALVNFCTGFRRNLPKKLETYLNVENNLSAEKVLGFDFDQEDEIKKRQKLTAEYWAAILLKIEKGADIKRIYENKKNRQKLGHCSIFPREGDEKNLKKLNAQISPEDKKSLSALLKKWDSSDELDISELITNPIGSRTLEHETHANGIQHKFSKISEKLESMIEEKEEISPLLIFIFCSQNINQRISPMIQDFLIKSLSYLLLITPKNLGLIKSKNSWFIWKMWVEKYKKEIQSNPNIKELLLNTWGSESSIPQFIQNIYNQKTPTEERTKAVQKRAKNIIKKKKEIPLTSELSEEKKEAIDVKNAKDEAEKTFNAPEAENTDNPCVFHISGLTEAQEKNPNIQLWSTQGILTIDENGEIDLSKYQHKKRDVTLKLWFGLGDKDPAKFHLRKTIILPQFREKRVLDQTPIKVKVGKTFENVECEEVKLSEKETQQLRLFSDLEDKLNKSFVLCLENEKVDLVNEKGCVFTLSPEILRKYPMCKGLGSFGYDSKNEELLLDGEELISDLTDILELLALEIMEDSALEIQEIKDTEKERKKAEAKKEKTEKAKKNYEETKKFLSKFPELNKINKLFLSSTPKSFKTNTGVWTWHFFARGGKYEDTRNKLNETLDNEGIELTLNTIKGQGLQNITLQMGESKIEIFCDNTKREFHTQSENKDENYNKLFSLGRQVFAYMAVKTANPKAIKTIEETKEELGQKKSLIKQLNQGKARASNGKFKKPSKREKNIQYFLNTDKNICAVQSKLLVSHGTIDEEGNPTGILFDPSAYEIFREGVSEHDSFKKYFIRRVIDTHRSLQGKSTKKAILDLPKAKEIIQEIFTRKDPSKTSLEIMLNVEISPHQLIEVIVSHGEISLSFCDYIIEKFEQAQIGIQMQKEASYSINELQCFADKEDLPFYMPVD